MTCKRARSWLSSVGVGGYLGSMRYEEVAALRAGSPAWRLLRAENAPLILSFLGRLFVDDNVREISATELISTLDDELYALNRSSPWFGDVLGL